eukprot:SM000034S12700  [mRNA]  locus=s34:300726:307620:+ [translate_table: standard]
MYSAGRFLSQGLYTVSGPFHPFGGAVDIIVVEQEDGTFKTSPWYVRFGKFQGVLKRREKVVQIAVDGVEATLTMFLDHKGEAYFLQDADEGAEDAGASLDPLLLEAGEMSTTTSAAPSRQNSTDDVQTSRQNSVDDVQSGKDENSVKLPYALRPPEGESSDADIAPDTPTEAEACTSEQVVAAEDEPALEARDRSSSLDSVNMSEFLTEEDMKLKQEIEKELAWHQVVEKASVALREAPMSAKLFLEASQQKEGKETAKHLQDRKSWGWWGWRSRPAVSAPLDKQASADSSASDRSEQALTALTPVDPKGGAQGKRKGKATDTPEQAKERALMVAELLDSKWIASEKGRRKKRDYERRRSAPPTLAASVAAADESGAWQSVGAAVERDVEDVASKSQAHSGAKGRTGEDETFVLMTVDGRVVVANVANDERLGASTSPEVAALRFGGLPVDLGDDTAETESSNKESQNHGERGDRSPAVEEEETEVMGTSSGRGDVSGKHSLHVTFVQRRVSDEASTDGSEQRVSLPVDDATGKYSGEAEGDRKMLEVTLPLETTSRGESPITSPDTPSSWQQVAQETARALALNRTSSRYFSFGNLSDLGQGTETEAEGWHARDLRLCETSLSDDECEGFRSCRVSLLEMGQSMIRDAEVSSAAAQQASAAAPQLPSSAGDAEERLLNGGPDCTNSLQAEGEAAEGREGAHKEETEAAEGSQTEQRAASGTHSDSGLPGSPEQESVRTVTTLTSYGDPGHDDAGPAGEEVVSQEQSEGAEVDGVALVSNSKIPAHEDDNTGSIQQQGDQNALSIGICDEDEKASSALEMPGDIVVKQQYGLHSDLESCVEKEDDNSGEAADSEMQDKEEQAQASLEPSGQQADEAEDHAVGPCESPSSKIDAADMAGPRSPEEKYSTLDGDRKATPQPAGSPNTKSMQQRLLSSPRSAVKAASLRSSPTGVSSPYTGSPSTAAAIAGAAAALAASAAAAASLDKDLSSLPMTSEGLAKAGCSLATLSNDLPAQILAENRRLQTADPQAPQRIYSTGDAESDTDKLDGPQDEHMGDSPGPVSHSDMLEGQEQESDLTHAGAGAEINQLSSTGMELSLCRDLLVEGMGSKAAAAAFSSKVVTLEHFVSSYREVTSSNLLVVRVGGKYYPWHIVQPLLLGMLAFGRFIPVTDGASDGSIAVEKPEAPSTSALAIVPARPTAAASSQWKLWPFGGTGSPPSRADRISQAALLAAVGTAHDSPLVQDLLAGRNGFHFRNRKVRSYLPTSEQLKSLNLKEGKSCIHFNFVTRVLGRQQVEASLYLWKWKTRIVISDVDGTITRSDLLGQVMPLVGRDWSQLGVARLFSAIKENGYEFMFLSARAISQAYLTRTFLFNLKQDGMGLPEGPVVISPDGLFPSLYREVIRRAPHEFKINCLQAIRALFPKDVNPFYAGFGNRDTDEISYEAVGIPKGKIYTINPKGEIVVNKRVDVRSYTTLHDLVDDMFPPVNSAEAEDYNSWNYWKIPLPQIDDKLATAPKLRKSNSGR